MDPSLEVPRTPKLGYVKVVVVGAPRCGKTSFIRSFYDSHIWGCVYFKKEVTVYPCQFWENQQQRKMKIYEIPGDPEYSSEDRIAYYIKANVVVFMYAIDDPASFWILITERLTEIIVPYGTDGKRVVFVGAKKDRRSYLQLMHRPDSDDPRPVTLEDADELSDQITPSLPIFECTFWEYEQICEFFFKISRLVPDDDIKPVDDAIVDDESEESVDDESEAEESVDDESEESVDDESEE